MVLRNARRDGTPGEGWHAQSSDAVVQTTLPIILLTMTPDSRSMGVDDRPPGDGLDHRWYSTALGVPTIANAHQRSPARAVNPPHHPSMSPCEVSPCPTPRMKEIYADGEEWIGRGS